MDNHVVVYHKWDGDESYDQMTWMASRLAQFVDMVGDATSSFYFDDESSQPQLQEAIEECRNTGANLLCYDLSSLGGSEDKGMGVVDALTEEMVFVMFVDEESTMATIGGRVYG